MNILEVIIFNFYTNTTGLDNSDIISIIGIFVDIAIAIGLVIFVNIKISQKSRLKDFFIDDIVALRNEYNEYTNLISDGQTIQECSRKAKKINSKFAILNDFILESFKMKIPQISEYQFQLLTKIVNIAEENNSDKVIYNDELMMVVEEFHNKINILFTEIICNVVKK
ncbi:MAG: hypothetical protein H6Q15_481 [Bacteroidetes bacterium]|nr:hypothetical protein [Bacteroidota bacterium]